MQDYTISEIKEIIATIKDAYKTALSNGGVTSYSIKSGQGDNSVTQASLATLSEQLTYWTYLLNERLELETGSNSTYIRSAGV